MRRSATVEHWYERNHVRSPKSARATTARRQAMRRVGQRPSRHMVRHYRRQKTVSWRQVVGIILLGLLTIPVSMAVAIYI